MSASGKKPKGSKVNNYYEVGTHGSKYGKERLPVAEQGENLNFYQSYRNEPVPPDPAIISAVKFTPAVPPVKNARIPVNIEAGRPVIPSSNRRVIYGLNLKERGSLPIPVSPFSESWSDARTGLNGIQKSFTEAKNEIQESAKTSIAKLPNAANSCAATLNALEINGRDKVKAEQQKNYKLKESRGIELVTPDDDSNGLCKTRKGQTSSVCGKGLKGLFPLTNGFQSRNEEVVTQPLLFIDSKALLMDVEIVNLSGGNQVVIRCVDPKWHDELDTLEQDMSDDWEKGKGMMSIDSKSQLKVSNYYALRLPENQRCVRIQVLNLTENSENEALVFLIDYGIERVVLPSNIFQMKPEWKPLPQLSCCAEIKGIIGVTPKSENGQMKLGKEFLNKTICVLPLLPEIVMTREVSEGRVSCKVRAVQLKIWDEEDSNKHAGLMW